MRQLRFFTVKLDNIAIILRLFLDIYHSYW